MKINSFFGKQILIGISIGLISFFISCSNKDNKNNKIENSDSIKAQKLKKQFIEKFDVNSCAPYLDHRLVRNIIDGYDDIKLVDETYIEIPNKFSGDISDIFPKGQAYIVDLESISDIERYGFRHKSLYDNSNLIYLNVLEDSENLGKNENDIYAVIVSDSVKYIPYRRSTIVFLRVVSYFNINDYYNIDFEVFNKSLKNHLEIIINKKDSIN